MYEWMIHPDTKQHWDKVRKTPEKQSMSKQKYRRKDLITESSKTRKTT